MNIMDKYETMHKEDLQQYKIPKEEQEDTIDLLELLFELFLHWKWILAVVLLCAGAAGIFNTYCVVPSYQAKAQIYITNTEQMIDIQNVQLSAELTVDYEEILRSYTVLQKVIDDLKLPMDYEELSSHITITNPNDSHILKIYVETEDSQLSMNIANTLLKYGIDYIYRIVGNDEPTIIDCAVDKTTKTVKTSTLKFALMGGLIGGIIICGIFIVRYLMDMTFKTEEDAENYMQLPVLAVIPVFADKEKKQENSSRKKGRKKHDRKKYDRKKYDRKKYDRKNHQI